MFILRGGIAEDAQNKAVADYKASFEPHGEVSVNEWGKRKLAFAIDHIEDGHYVLMAFNSDLATLRSVEGRMKLDENVLRHMVVRREVKVAAPVAG